MEARRASSAGTITRSNGLTSATLFQKVERAGRRAAIAVSSVCAMALALDAVGSPAHRKLVRVWGERGVPGEIRVVLHDDDARAESSHEQGLQ